MTAAAPSPPGTAVDTQSFFFPGGGNGCLLLHGFTGTPHEMRFLGRALAARGHTVSGIRLAGHCTRVEDLAATRWTDWYASAQDGLQALRSHTSRLVVVGQSMGALLALELAVQHRDVVAAVAVLSPALVLSHPLIRFGGRILPYVVPLLPERRRYVGKGVSDIADPRARAESPSYRRIPLPAVVELLGLQRRVRRRLPMVRQPVLAIHALQDHTCPVTNVELLERGLGGPLRSRILTRSYHVISVDVERDLVAELVADFVAAPAGKAETRIVP